MSIYINLNDDETRDLEELAQQERRTPQAQAAYMVVSQIAQRKAFENMNAQMAKLQAEFPDDCSLGAEMPPYAQAAARVPVLKGGDD